MAVFVAFAFATIHAALPPGPGPFGSTLMLQPVPGAPRGVSVDGWKQGKLCDVSLAPYNVQNNTNATAALQKAIDDCGDLPGGGTVRVPPGMHLQTASLFLKSNLTFRVEIGAVLLGSLLKSDAPMIYARRNCLMTQAHAGFLNGGQCIKYKSPLVGWDDCAEWSKLENVVVEGGGTLDANGDFWYHNVSPEESNMRPMMLDFMWVDGLTVRDMHIRRPGYWTVHPTFSNNVRVENNDILTYGSNTDGCDPDSSWNVYIAGNSFSTGDDCIAIKAGRDWSGRMVNISTQNVLAEKNSFLKGHGVSIGSETSGWVRNITIRDSKLDGTNLAVRIKTMRGRGGGVEDVLYQNLTGSTVSGIQLTLNYGSASPTNSSATPEMRRITIKDVNIHAGSFLTCNGLPDSEIEGIIFDNVVVTGGSHQSCSDCTINAKNTSPQPKCGAPSPPAPPPALCRVTTKVGCYDDSKNIGLGLALQDQVHDKTTLEVCAGACFSAKLLLAAIDEGNHCYCGNQEDLQDDEHLIKPASECEATSCHSNTNERCGGKGRLLTYTYGECSPSPAKYD